MAQERISAEVWRDMMLGFMRGGPQLGISNFTLKGSIDVSTYFDNFVGIFAEGMVVVGSSIGDRTEFFSRILDVGVPERVKQFPVVGDESLRDATRLVEGFHAMMSMPTRVLAFGKARDTGEEIVVLFTTAGIHPQEALDEIKEKVRERLAQLN